MFDPSSAVFRGIQTTELGYCGEVNGKNRFGGYVGYRKFHAMKKQEGGWIISYDAPLVAAMCK
jgi:hypothetical protein